MRASGLVTAGAIKAVKAAVRPGVSTGELDAVAEDHIRSHGAVPNFLGYHGFTGTICASINDEIVHGIPNPDRRAGRGRQHLHRLRRHPRRLAQRLRGDRHGGGALAPRTPRCSTSPSGRCGRAGQGRSPAAG